MQTFAKWSDLILPKYELRSLIFISTRLTSRINPIVKAGWAKRSENFCPFLRYSASFKYGDLKFREGEENVAEISTVGFCADRWLFGVARANCEKFAHKSLFLGIWIIVFEALHSHFHVLFMHKRCSGIIDIAKNDILGGNFESKIDLPGLKAIALTKQNKNEKVS